MSEFQLSPKKRQAVFDRDGWECVYCNITLTLELVNIRVDENGEVSGSTPPGMGRPTIDHIIPRCKGGTHDMENLAACCSTCNTRKHTKTLDEWVAVRAKAVN